MRRLTIAIALLFAFGTGHVVGSTPTFEQSLVTSLQACTIIREAQLRRIPLNALPQTLARCQRIAQ